MSLCLQRGLERYSVLGIVGRVLQPSEKGKFSSGLKMTLGSAVRRVSQGLGGVLGFWGEVMELDISLSSHAESPRQATLCVPYLPLIRPGCWCWWHHSPLEQASCTEPRYCTRLNSRERFKRLGLDSAAKAVKSGR